MEAKNCFIFNIEQSPFIKFMIAKSTSENENFDLLFFAEC